MGGGGGGGDFDMNKMQYSISLVKFTRTDEVLAMKFIIPIFAIKKILISFTLCFKKHVPGSSDGRR